MRSRNLAIGAILTALGVAATVPASGVVATAGAGPDRPPPIEHPITRPVRVVNEADEPVPVDGFVEITGTADVSVTNTHGVTVENAPDVNVANTPGVNVANTPGVTVENAPDVNVANTPEVTVGNTPGVNVLNTPSVQVDGTVGVAGDVQSSQSGPWTVGLDPDDNTVTVANSADGPLLVSDVGAGAIEPFAAEMAGSDRCVTVPEGKRFLIEFVTWSGSQEAGDTVFVRPGFTAVTGGTKVRHTLAFETLFTPMPSGPDRQWYTASQATQVYADPETEVCVQFLSLSGGIDSQWGSVSGHLIDVG